MLGFYRRQSCAIYFCVILEIKSIGAGADPGFFLGGGALVSCSTSTPINHIVFFCTPCTLPLDPPLSANLWKRQTKLPIRGGSSKGNQIGTPFAEEELLM